MAHIKIVPEDEAVGTVAEDYAFLRESYSKLSGRDFPTPQVYRPASLIPEYFRFGALQNRVLTGGGTHPAEDGPIPRILINFAVSLHSSCFY